MTTVWEQRKVSEITTSYSGGTPKSGTAEYYDGDIPFIRSGEIYSDTTELFITESGMNNSSAKMVHIGDILYALYGATSGEVSRAKLDGAINQAILAIIPNEEINADFLVEWFRKEKDKITDTYLQGGQGNLSAQIIKELEVLIPSEDEQNKIGTYFEQLNNLITLHQRKCDEIKKLKKYMLQKMFPQNGKNVPEIRFSGFTDVWEQRKLGDVFKEYAEKNHIELPALTIIQGGGTVKREDSERNLMYDKSNLSNYKIVRKDDFIVHLRSFEGGLEKSSLDGIISPAYHTFHSDIADSRFYYPYFRSYEFIKHKLVPHVYGIRDGRSIDIDGMKTIEIPYTSIEEQKKIGDYLDSLDHLITLHQRKCDEIKKLKKYMLQKMFPQNGKNVPEIRFSGFTDVWEQRKFSEFVKNVAKKNKENLDLEPYAVTNDRGFIAQKDAHDDFGYMKDTDRRAYNIVPPNSFAYNPARINVGSLGYYTGSENVIVSSLYEVFQTEDYIDDRFLWHWLKSDHFPKWIERLQEGSVRLYFYFDKLVQCQMMVPTIKEQNQISAYFDSLDKLITLHHHKPHPTLHCIYIHIKEFFNRKEDTYMPELEQMIENKLIEQLVYGDSQWTYREDLKTEEDLWANFRYILEQNNKDRLNGEPLSDSEFEQVKNQLQFSSFYKAGEWLVGENGKVQVHVQRDTEKIHLVVMNHEHIAGGSSVYEVINQYSALKSDDDDDKNNVRNRRFDVTLLINGLPMIHIELKNKKHPYMDAFRQIKKYIGEGKFTGIFSAVQMFVISNGVDTRYFSAASDTELNPKFMSCWLDKDNNPVTDYLEFAKNVLRIPEAHEMIARYTVLDKNAKRLILLRPYQIHAIEAIRDASKTGRSGFVWHTTGSGKTLTSYKATRNLLMDIPSIDKTIFLIDRKDLDTQTTMAFQAYANNDVITVDETNNINELKDRLKSLDRTVIVTTIQKLQRLIDNRLVEGTPEYNRIKNLKIGFIVDDERVIIRTKLEKPSKIKGLALI